jgi:hypothetical protein
MHRSTWISALLVASGLAIAGLASAGPARIEDGPRPQPPRAAPDECRDRQAGYRCAAPSDEAARDRDEPRPPWA